MNHRRHYHPHNHHYHNHHRHHHIIIIIIVITTSSSTITIKQTNHHHQTCHVWLKTVDLIFFSLSRHWPSGQSSGLAHQRSKIQILGRDSLHTFGCVPEHFEHALA
jgi:phosphoribosyl-AMP cyclohydrolase